MKKKTILLGALGALLWAAASTAQTPPPAAPAPPEKLAVEPVRILAPLPIETLSAIRNQGTLRVGVSVFVPWAYFDKKGELVGYQIDLARKLAEDLGVALEIHPSSPDGLIPDLHEGETDLIASGMNVTPPRALVVSFSGPTGHSELRLLASRKLAGTFRTLADFNKETVTIAVRAGSSAEEAAKRLFPRAQRMMISEPFPSGYSDVAEGKIHALLGYSPLPEAEAARLPAELFLPLGEPVARFAEAFAVRPADGRLLQFLDSWLLFHEEDGWLAERRAYWFKSFQWIGEL